jgi:PAS domain S-box-containing protein
MILLWRQNRDRFAGTTFWVVDFAFQAAALLLIILRGAIPDWISMTLSNTLIITGALLGFIGLERFIDRKGRQIHNYLLVFLFVLGHSYFVLVRPSLPVRTIFFSLSLFLIFLQTVWLLWFRVASHLRTLTFGTGLVNLLYCVACLIRIVHEFLAAGETNDFFRTGLFDELMIISFQMLFIMLTYSFTLMVNKRLTMQLRTQEEKFSKAFHAAPYAVTLSKLSNGTIFDVNETFSSITGYSREEVLGKKSIDLGLWEEQDDRTAVIDTLLKAGTIQGLELKFQKKNKEPVIGIFYANIITIEGEKSILASIGDITERKQAEDQLSTSLKEKEILLKEIHHRVKNNLAIIGSILDLQAQALKDDSSKEVFRECDNRVRTMSKIHTQLYQSKDLAHIDYKTYLEELFNDIFRSYQIHPGSVILDLRVGDFAPTLDVAIPLSLILNELVSNSLKYAFPKGKKGWIQVALGKEEKDMVLSVIDNGVGFPGDLDLSKTESLGLQLVMILSQQLNGTVELNKDRGTAFIIRFPESSLVQPGKES